MVRHSFGQKRPVVLSTLAMPVMRTTSSLSWWVAVPLVLLPVVAKMAVPSEAMPPEAQMASPCPPVTQAAAVGHVEDATEQRQGAALVLLRLVEGLAARGHAAQVDRPARLLLTLLVDQ